MKKQGVNGSPKRSDEQSQDFGVTGSNPEMVARLREAVRIGGGPTQVAEKSRLPLRTLANYLAGRGEPRATAIGAIARACDVSVQWLIYGDGPAESKHFRGWEPHTAHPIGQAALFLYQRIYAAGNLITPEAFEELLVEMYNMYADGVPEDDPRWAQLRRVLEIALRGTRGGPGGPAIKD